MPVRANPGPPLTGADFAMPDSNQTWTITWRLPMRRFFSVAVLIATCFAPATAIGEDAAAAFTGAPARAAAYNATGGKLMRAFSAKPGNVVFSPVSIGLVMSMAAHGARGVTRDEMLRVLSVDDDGVESADVMRILNSYDTSADPSARLSIGNALMVYRGDVLPDYAGDLRRDYGADVFRKPDLATINDWVTHKTHGAIGKIVDRLSPDDVLVVLNAAYFKADWAAAFDKSATKEAPFWLSPQTSAPVATMHHTGSFGIVKGHGFRAIRLPYTVEQLGMVIVVPDAIDGAGAISAGLDGVAFGKLRADLDNAQVRLVDLSLPKFRFSYDAGSLVASFRALGLKVPFDQGAADFSGIGANLFISNIFHRATIEADETGTQASAATAAVMTERSVLPRQEQPEVLRVDRTFLFFVVDATTGAVLFQGRVSDPRAS
jgi:serpin B